MIQQKQQHNGIKLEILPTTAPAESTTTLTEKYNTDKFIPTITLFILLLYVIVLSYAGLCRVNRRTLYV